jgi:hypothetical protein
MFASSRDPADAGDRPRDMTATIDREPQAARYLTDGSNLYRIVDGLGSSFGETVIGLEDCRTLEVILIALEDLRALGLCPVSTT